MSKAERKRKKLQHRKVIEIPPKNDISLFQKQRCIESLPTPIFQLIQDYSKGKDYRNLMNTNLSTFQPVKSETVKYSLIGPKLWNRVNCLGDKEARLLQIIRSVKDKSKQISISISQVKQLTLLKYVHLFEGIHTFHYNGCEWGRTASFDQSFSFDIFNNIHHLLLEDLHGISTIKSAPRHIVKLELIDCGFSRFEDLNPTNTLKELKIRSNKDLEVICFLDGISKLQIQSTRNIELLFPRNCIDFELACGSFSKILTTDFRFAIPNERLHIIFPSNLLDSSSFRIIP
jgi:hypothetical protein